MGLVAFDRQSLHFIVGVPRSGTSLCRIMLGSHPRILAPSETPWVFGAYGEEASLAALLGVLSTSKFGAVKSIAGVSVADIHFAARQFLLAIFASKMRAEGKDVLMLKTPDDIAFIDDILEIFEQSIVVHVRRDVRDVALSTAKTGWKHLNFFGENNFSNCVRRWVAWERKIEAAKVRGADRIVSIRYEDLVLDPATTLQGLLCKLGLSFDETMLRYWEHAHRAPEWDTGSLGVARFTKIEPARALAYRAHTPADEQERIVAEHEADIIALGYTPGWD